MSRNKTKVGGSGEGTWESNRSDCLVGLVMSEGCRKELNRANETTTIQGKKEVYTRDLNNFV